MSKIEKILCEAGEVKRKRDEDDQAYYVRLGLAIQELPDAEWNKLDSAAQDWVNDVADAVAAKSPIKGFPDAEKAEEPATPTRRRAASQEAAEPAKAEAYEPKLKDVIALVTKRGKSITGKIVELDKDVMVVETADGEEEVDRDRIANIGLAGKGFVGAKEDEPAGPVEPKVGDTVTITTKRDKVITGELVELTEEDLVLKVDGKEEEFSRDRLIDIKVHGATKAAEQAPTGRRGSSASAEPIKGKEEAPADGKRSRASNGPGVSVGMRIRELIIADLKAPADDIAKILDKEKLEYRRNTLDLNFAEAHKMIGLLDKAGMLKK